MDIQNIYIAKLGEGQNEKLSLQVHERHLYICLKV